MRPSSVSLPVATTTPEAGYDHGPGERHAFPIPDRRVGGNRLCALVGRHRLAVPGDIVLLESGDKIPADLRLADAKNLRTEEAALTAR